MTTPAEYVSREPGLAEVIDRASRAGLADLHVSVPARVKRWDAAKQQIDAEVVVRSAYLDETQTRQLDPVRVILCVPVQFPSGVNAAGQTFSVKFPVNVGSPVWLVFSDVSLDKWLATGGIVDPGDDRQHALIDCVAVPGGRPFCSPLAAVADDCVEIGLDGSATHGVGLGDLLKTWLDSHTHTSAASGSPTSTPNPSTPGSGTDTLSPAPSATAKVSA